MRQPTPLDDYLFDLQGYLVLENALDADLLDELNAQFDRFPHDLPRAAWYQGAQRHEVSATSLVL